MKHLIEHLYSDGALTAAKWLMNKETWTLFDERFVKFLKMNEIEKAKKILKILNRIYPIPHLFL